MFAGKTVLVTGASSGIGRALALRFARENASLVLVARREDRLKKLAAELKETGPNTATSVIVADLTEPGACEQVATDAGAVDVLINNAGIGTYDHFARQNYDVMRRMMELNMVALTQLTHLLLPGMLERHSGWVLNVASLAAFQPMPYMSAYAATKSYVLEFSRSLREEVRRRGVVVTCLCPGTTRTEFFDRADYGQLRRGIDRMAADPAWVANCGFRALAKARAVCIPGTLNSLGIHVQRLLPTSLVASLMRRVLKPHL